MTRDDAIAAALRPVFAAEAAALARELEEAAAAGRDQRVRALAHRLVGMAGTVHEHCLVAAAHRLEQAAAAEAGDRLQAAVATTLASLRAAIEATRPAGSAELPPEAPGLPAAALPVVLAIEDDRANLVLLRRIVDEIPGVELVTAASGAEGLRLAADPRVRLVLLDRRLPDMAGEAVLAALRGGNGRPRVPVVVVTADADAATRREAERLGASGVLPKPFALARLRTLVESVRDSDTSRRPP